ncbi:MAG: DNA topoisomerase-1 [Cellvibrionaceae bacterium]|jgi:DNA topoisomerase-1
MANDIQIEGYCLKCKEHRVFNDPKAEWASNGTPAIRGKCSVCDANVYKRGMSPLHENLEKPAVLPQAKKKKATAKTKKGNKKTKTTARRSGRLVIVESPAKAKTIGKYLGKGYTVKSSVGHVRDLLKSRLSVDPENNFQPEYRVPNEKRALVKELKEAASKAQEIFLATDPDREGEAIAWHVMESAEMEPARTQRVVFHEITKPAVQAAFDSPREIDMKQVDAQQARRILDRLVGYKLSPLLWRKVRGRLSAGRVQSVALRLVVEREREVDAFEPVEYWTVQADVSQHKYEGDKNRLKFVAKWHRFEGKEPILSQESDVLPHLDILEKATWTIDDIKIGTRQRKPAAPFTTSTLQQEASRKLSYGTQKTMRVAQQLYEGIDIGSAEGNVGLITYMRTDSVTVSQLAQTEAREYVVGRFGADYIPATPPVYKTKAKNAQEAHEAVRPTGVMRDPKAMKDFLSRDQYRLYELIWQRFVGSQMSPAVYNTVRAELMAGEKNVLPKERPYHFRATGSDLKFAGFLAVYEESAPTDRPDGAENQVPADLESGEAIDLLKLNPEQHFTQPPPRFSEATLVKTMEEEGIGRPSTYASIVSTIQRRGYVVSEERRLYPTEIGTTVTDMLVEYFPDVLSPDFTARMEDELDTIATGDKEWVPVVDGFWSNFEKRLIIADESLPKVDLNQVKEYVGRECEECGEGQLVYRQGRFGKFIGCDNFPKCYFTEQVLVHTGVDCVCSGHLIERRTKKGRTFYGCSRYPECDFTSWKKPVSSDANGVTVQVNKEKTLYVPYVSKPFVPKEKKEKKEKKAPAAAD